MLNRRHIAASAALAFALYLTGCGYNHIGAPVPVTSKKPRITAAGDEHAAQLVAGVKNLSANLNTFTGVVSFWETDGKDVSTSTVEVFWAKPGKIRANITEASSAMKRGVKLVYLNDKKITAKLGFIKKTFAYDDPQVLSLRGYRIDQTNLTSFIDGITDPKAVVTYKGAVADGEQVDVVSPGLLPGTDRALVTLDAKTFVPVKLELYAKQDVVFKVDIKKPVVNPTLPSDIFNL